MPKINYVTKARNEQPNCGGCTKAIPAGSKYSWLKFRYGGRSVRCHQCRFRPSDQTQAKYAPALAACESVEDALQNWESEIIEDAISLLQEAAEV